MKREVSSSLKFLLIGLAFLPAIAFSQGKFLMVLDVQEQFIKDKPYADVAGFMIANINALIAGFDKDKILYVKSAEKALVINSKGFSTDTLPAPDFDPRLNIVNNNIFVKVSTGDAFSSPELTRYLTDRNAREIVITGLLAEKCISASALGGIKKGFDVCVIPDAITGKSEKGKNKAIEKLQQKGVKTLSMQETENPSGK